jgi:hypothetical protein
MKIHENQWKSIKINNYTGVDPKHNFRGHH